MPKLAALFSPERAADVIDADTRRLLEDRFEVVWADAGHSAGPAQPGKPPALDPAAAVLHYGQALFDFYVGALIRWRVLGGDPHPGNYLFCSDGRLAILDHGCTRTFDATSDRLVRVTLALEADSRAGVYDAIAQLCARARRLKRQRGLGLEGAMTLRAFAIGLRERLEQPIAPLLRRALIRRPPVHRDDARTA